MALSGNFNTNKYSTQSSGTIGLNLSWTATQSIANNTTTIKWTLKSNGTMSSGYSVYAGPVTVTINGTNVLNITSRFSMKGGGAFKKTGSITVTHAADGSKSVAMSVRAALYSSSVNCTGSYTYTLNKINRYALLSAVDSFDDELTGGYPKVVYTNPAGTDLVTDLYVRIKWTAIDQSTQATNWVKVNDEGGEYVFSSTSLTSQNIASMLAACPDSNQLAIQYEIKSTLDGVEYTDVKSSSMAVVNADPIPAQNAVSFLDTNTTVINNLTHDNQIIVQKQSTLKIQTALSTAVKSASIVSYVLNINGNDYVLDSSNNYSHSFVQPDATGVFVATVTTTDSRGNKATATKEITILAWELPSGTYSIERLNGFETSTTFVVDGKFSAVGGLNSITIKEKHRTLGSSSWSSETVIPDNTATTVMLDLASDWEVMITVSDKLASVEYITTVGRGIPIAFIDTLRRSFGINGFPDADNQLYVGGSIKATGNVQGDKAIVNKISTTNEDVTFSKSSGSWTFNSGEYTRCGNVVQVRLGFKGGGSNVAVGSNAIVGTINGAPSPAYTVRLQGYYSGTVLMGELTSSGGFNVRVLGQALNLSTANTATLSGTFIVED